MVSGEGGEDETGRGEGERFVEVVGNETGEMTVDVVPDFSL